MAPRRDRSHQLSRRREHHPIILSRPRLPDHPIAPDWMRRQSAQARIWSVSASRRPPGAITERFGNERGVAGEEVAARASSSPNSTNTASTSSTPTPAPTTAAPAAPPPPASLWTNRGHAAAKTAVTPPHSPPSPQLTPFGEDLNQLCDACSHPPPRQRIGGPAGRRRRRWTAPRTQHVRRTRGHGD